MIPSQWLATLLGGALAVQGTLAINVNVNDFNSLKSAAKTVAADLITYYNDRAEKLIPGKLDGTWWEGGAMFMTLIQYWWFTGDSQYNSLIQAGMYWQAGPGNYMPTNYSQYLGNDDQVFWGLAAMTAAEFNFPEQPGQPSWVSLAQGVFNTQVPRWDTSSCHGGMRWQMWQWQEGYFTKNAISNGGLFQLSARLARYTQNTTYSDWAERIWDWSATTPLLRENVWTIADSTTCESQCTAHGDLQWTYNYGTYISGAAYMYNLTNGDQKWMDGIQGLYGTSSREFYPTQGFDGDGGTILSDITCEPVNKCNRNEVLFKAFFSTWLAFMSTIVPDTLQLVLPRLQTSATAAAKTCTGGSDGTLCGIAWYTQTFDTPGLEQEVAVLGGLTAAMVNFDQRPPFTAHTGGKSIGNPAAGTNSTTGAPPVLESITSGDRAGAGVLTVIFVAGWSTGLWWMVKGG